MLGEDERRGAFSKLGGDLLHKKQIAPGRKVPKRVLPVSAIFQ